MEQCIHSNMDAPNYQSAKINRDITPEWHKVVMFQIKLDFHFFCP